MIASIDFDDPDELKDVFSGYGCVASREKYVREELRNFIEHTYHLTSLRFTTAVTGAMRWPWSQEARMCVEHRVFIE